MMIARLTLFSIWAAAAALGVGVVQADDRLGLKEGFPNLKSAGPLAFGPEGVLFVGDPLGAAVFAIATSEPTADLRTVKHQIDRLDEKLAAALDVPAGQVTINDLAAHPANGSLYLSVTKAGAKPGPALVRIGPDGKLAPLSLEKVKFSQAVLTAAGGAAAGKPDAITDLAWVEGQVIVAGMAAGPSPSTVRGLTFPFIAANEGASLEIYHGAHGRFEENAAVRTFVPFTIGGQPSLLAGFTCTPLVKIPISGIVAGKKTKGTTVAELGNRNRPLDMIVYKQAGKDFLLMANSARGVMKISTENLEKQEGITQPVKGGGVAGLPYETIKDLVGVTQLDRLNDTQAVIVQTDTGGGYHLRTIDLP